MGLIPFEPGLFLESIDNQTAHATLSLIRTIRFLETLLTPNTNIPENMSSDTESNTLIYCHQFQARFRQRPMFSGYVTYQDKSKQKLSRDAVIRLHQEWSSSFNFVVCFPLCPVYINSNSKLVTGNLILKRFKCNHFSARILFFLSILLMMFSFSRSPRRP